MVPIFPPRSAQQRSKEKRHPGCHPPKLPGTRKSVRAPVARLAWTCSATTNINIHVITVWSMKGAGAAGAGALMADTYVPQYLLRYILN